jgi:apolipoprotein N-acyltransferase
LPPPVAAGVLLVMAGGLALYWGLFTAALPAVFGGPWRTLIGAGALWTATEFARGHVFIGFPWLYLGYAATGHAMLARLASVTGVYGLSFVIAAFNAGVFLVIRNPQRSWGMRLAVALFALAGLSLSGGLLKGGEPARETAYLVQTNVPLEQEWTGCTLRRARSFCPATLATARTAAWWSGRRPRRRSITTTIRGCGPICLRWPAPPTAR